MIFLFLSLAQQYAFYAFKGFPIVWLSAEKYLGLLLVYFIFTFCPGPKLRFFLLSHLLILNAFQMGHLSFFGTQVLPNEIWLFFNELHEVGGTVGAELQHIFIPLAFTLVPMFIGLYFIYKYRTTYASKFIPILVLLYAVYNPARTYITGNTWGRQPSTHELAGMNLYLSFSYFFGKILPSKLSNQKFSVKENESLRLKLDELKTSEWDNIIVVLGESLTPHHMSLFGYERNTTPYIDTLKDSPNFINLIGLSSGVSTDISVAFFLNMGYGDAGGMKAAKGEHCLIKLAKEAKFSTHFLSMQSSEQLRYIAPYLCTAYLDDYQSLENVSPKTVDHQAAIDRDVLPKLSALLETPGKKFIMLHQRGSHSPWARRFRPESAKFKSEGTDSRINDYDNSVVEFDSFWKELNLVLNLKDTKTLVVYLSDHGESLGEGQRWGHGFLQPRSFEIPILIQAFGNELPVKNGDFKNFLPQYNLSLFIAKQIGWSANQDPSTPVKDFVIYGNDIDGFAGKAEITFDEKSYKFKVVP